MKKALFTLSAAALFAATTTAQNINDRTWTDGLGGWHCSKENNGNYQFIGGYTDAGLDWELKSIGGDKYKVIDAEYNMSGNGCNVTKIKITDGYDIEHLILVARDSKNVITALLTELKDWNSSKELFLDMLDGIYTDPQGKQYNFARESLNGEKFETIHSEGDMSQCFKLKDGKVYWAEFTDKGIDLYNTVWDDDSPWGYYKKTTIYKSLTKKDQITEILTGQYPYTSTKLILPASLDYFTKAQLRVMRNEIYARHGYVFSSADLKAHFAKMSWYKPLNDNSKIQLSQLEQLNVDLIKAEENKKEK